MSNIKFFRVVDREPEDWSKSSNGGDYEEGRTIAVQDGNPIAVRFWSSWDGGFCHLCGRYEPFECNCNNVAQATDFEGWQNGELLTGWAEELANSRLENGGYALIK